MNNDINALFERIISLYDSGGDPNKMLNSMINSHPNINQMGIQFNNMTQGKSRPEAYMQMAKQLGLNDKNMQGLARIMGVKQ